MSLGVFIHDVIPKQLLDASLDLGTEPISLIPPGKCSRFVLERARELVVTHDKNNQITNYLKIKSSAKTRKIGVESGYIFNSSNHLWQQDPFLVNSKNLFLLQRQSP